MKLKGTKSEQNIKTAFAGESQARNKYTYFADAARKEGHEDIAELFQKMADNEREHARIWFNLLHDGIPDTVDNLIDASMGENYEWKTMYPDFAATAKEEGLDTLANMFERVAAIENDHERRFIEAFIEFKSKSLNKAKDRPLPDSISARQQETQKAAVKPYRCMFCGAPADSHLDVCPVCSAIGAYEHIS